MNITDINVVVISDSNVKGIATIVIDNAIAIHSIRIFEKDGDYIISMPSRKKQDGTWSDYVHPINSEARAVIQKAIVDKYKELIS